MTFPLAPRWALAAQAIAGDGDPHLKPGVHLKIMPSHHLGLPLTPFIVYRYNLGPSARLGGLRTEITWVDSHGAALHTPFNVTADNPVTGYLPVGSGDVCGWIDVDATPASPTPPVFPVSPIRQPIRDATPARRPASRVPDAVRPRPIDVLPADLLDVIRVRATIRVDATVATSRGMAIVASTLGPDYQLAYTPIQQVTVTGTGRVAGVRWLSVLKLKQIEEVWRLLALPVPHGRRYAGIPDAEARAKDRIVRGAPLRFGLHDQPDAATPGAAGPATDADELARITAGRPVLDTWLDKLLNDMSAPPDELRTPVAFNPGPTSGTLQVPCLGALLQASLDPGVGRWLGYGDRDEAPPGAPGDVVVYLIRALFGFDPKELGPLGSQIKPLRAADALAGLHVQLDTRELKITGDVLDLGTIVCATIGNPPLHLPPPAIGTARSPLVTPPNLVGPEAWLPRTPPDAARELVVPLSHLGPGACVALARRTTAGITGLNRRTPEGRAISLVSTASPSATSPGEMTFRDGTAPPDALFYRAAQADWFGRWSPWSESAAAAGVRPPPPIPTVIATYAQPAIPDPMPTGPLAGTLRVEVAVPEPGALTPGGQLIRSATILVDATATSIDVADPAAPQPGEITARLAGPAIERAGTRVVTVKAKFRDTAGTFGGESTPVTLICRDPRPPEEVALPLTLLYGSRPDATGVSRVTLRWTATVGQAGFRLFYADELRLGAALDKIGAGGDARAAQARSIRAALDAAPDAPSRAAVLTANRAFFDRGMFEQLTETPLPGVAGSTMQFDHELSGSLRVLSLYRVVSVSASQVESPFTASGIAVYAVPNTGPPPGPQLTARPDPAAPAGTQRALLAISVPRGLVKATEYRLRRSTRKSAEPHEMITVATGAFVDPPAPPARPEDPQVMTVVDDGGSILGPGSLRAWTQYNWIVEVRGNAEDGGGPSATWSTASAAASILFVPPAPPIAPAITGAKVGSDFELTWTVADPLKGGQVGDYKLELYRRRPGEHERVLAVISGEAKTSFHYLDAAPPTGTTYRVIVRDPAGRTSLPTPTLAVE